MNNIKVFVLMAGMTALFGALGATFGGQSGMLMALVFAGAMNVFMYYNSSKMVLRMYGARVISEQDAPDLYHMVDRLRQRAGLPMPTVALAPHEQPNAFATGRNPSHAAVAATEGILRVLSEPELEGVLAHELAHVQHRDILISSVAATIAAAIMMVARMAHFAALFGGYGNRDDRNGTNPIALLATMIFAPFAAMLIQMAISRSREFAADAGGAALAGNPFGLAEALRKIDAISKRLPLDANPATAHMFIIKPFAGGGMMSLFSSHPPTEARIAALLGRR